MVKGVIKHYGCHKSRGTLGLRRTKGESEFGQGVRESERLLKEVAIPSSLPSPRIILAVYQVFGLCAVGFDDTSVGY